MDLRQPLVYAVLVALVTAGLAVTAIQGSRLPWMNAPILPGAAPLPAYPADSPTTPDVDGSPPFVPDIIEPMAPLDVSPRKLGPVEPIGAPEKAPAAPSILPPAADNTRPFDANAPRPMAPGAPFKRYATDETVPGTDASGY